MMPETRLALEAIAQRHGFTLDALKGPTKFRSACAARRECYRYLADERDWSHAQIARLFNRDRTCVTLALDKNEHRPARLEQMRERYFKIKAAGSQPLGARRVG